MRIEDFHFEKYVKAEKFDRHDPNANLHFLKKLRSKGYRRLTFLARGHEITSAGLTYLLTLLIWRSGDTGVFFDLGCGDSPDGLIMANRGWKSYGFDLLDPSERAIPFLQEFGKGKDANFIRHDVVEKFPKDIPKADVVLSQAMFTLIHKDDQKKFFENIYRQTKDKCIFVVNAQKLTSGYYDHWDIAQGRLKNDVLQKSVEAGWRVIGNSSNTLFIFTK